MLLAVFYRGPFNDRRMVLPTEEPWPRFVIPEQWEPFLVEALYLLAGRLDDDAYAYLYEDDWGALLAPGQMSPKPD